MAGQRSPPAARMGKVPGIHKAKKICSDASSTSHKNIF